MPPNRRLLITAGPTHEPIDAVRFIGNRSSGRLGIALADEADRRGWTVTLLLGPVCALPERSSVRLIRFRTTTDLQQLLTEHTPSADVLVMAAAVADYRPRADIATLGKKIRRTEGPLVLELEPTPDLLAGIARTRRPEQLLVGFALEPRAEMLDRAVAKLARKKVDLIIANPLETMDAESIEAVALAASGARHSTAGPILKREFAGWLLALIETEAANR